MVDSWPVMEWLKRGQPAALFFRHLIERANHGEVTLWISVMNVGEVYYSSGKEWGLERADEILDRVAGLPMTPVSVTDEQVMAAARLKAVYNIAYADAFAASLAIGKSCALVTGDQEFRALERDGLLQIEWLGV